MPLTGDPNLHRDIKCNRLYCQVAPRRALVPRKPRNQATASAEAVSAYSIRAFHWSACRLPGTVGMHPWPCILVTGLPPKALVQCSCHRASADQETYANWARNLLAFAEGVHVLAVFPITSAAGFSARQGPGLLTTQRCPSATHLGRVCGDVLSMPSWLESNMQIYKSVTSRRREEKKYSAKNHL